MAGQVAILLCSRREADVAAGQVYLARVVVGQVYRQVLRPNSPQAGLWPSKVRVEKRGRGRRPSRETHLPVETSRSSRVRL